jgi:hypothetical protein
MIYPLVFLYTVILYEGIQDCSIGQKDEKGTTSLLKSPVNFAGLSFPLFEISIFYKLAA